MMKAMCHKFVFLFLLAISTPTSPGALAETLESSFDLYVLGVYEGHAHTYGKVTVFIALLTTTPSLYC